MISRGTNIQVKLADLPKTVKSVVVLKNKKHELFVNNLLKQEEINFIIDEAFMQLSNAIEYK